MNNKLQGQADGIEDEDEYEEEVDEADEEQIKSTTSN